MAAAQSQPGRRALPMLVSQWAASADEHMALASRIDPFEDAIAKALTPRFKYIAVR